MATVVTSLLLLLLHGSCIDGRSAPLKTDRIMHESTVDLVQRQKIDQKNARTRKKKKKKRKKKKEENRHTHRNNIYTNYELTEEE